MRESLTAMEDILNTIRLRIKAESGSLTNADPQRLLAMIADAALTRIPPKG